jgi:formylglycine-generating enzyme required for sulfatase activity
MRKAKMSEQANHRQRYEKLQELRQKAEKQDHDLRQEIEELKKQLAQERQERKKLEHWFGVEEFTFRTLIVDEAGKIKQEYSGKAEQKIIDLGNNVFLEMVMIPGGSFRMGAPATEKESRDEERPQHKVNIAPFLMGKYPVTQAQYEVVMGSNPSHFKGKDRPVETVSWHEAKEFCKRLSEKTGRKYRLPSEAEWEYACRAGTTTPFHFGETITTDLANYDGDEEGVYRRETTPVGSFPPNAFGLYDLHGNVCEWCEDVWHENYEGAPNDGSAWLTGEYHNWRVMRGGSWLSPPRNCRCAYRHWGVPDVDYNIIGFRVVSSSVRTL